MKKIVYVTRTDNPEDDVLYIVGYNYPCRLSLEKPAGQYDTITVDIPDRLIKNGNITGTLGIWDQVPDIAESTYYGLVHNRLLVVGVHEE